MKKRANKRWTQDEIQKLKKLADGNTPTRIIGLKLERTTESIYAKSQKEKISLAPTNQSPYDRKVSNEKKKEKK